MHLVWMSVFVPGTLFVVWAFPAGRKSIIWSAVFGVAIAGLAAVVGLDLFVFFTQRGGSLSHGPMRAVFAVIMSTDFPLVALAVGSFACWMVSRRNHCSIDRAGSFVPTPSAKERSREE